MKNTLIACLVLISQQAFADEVLPNITGMPQQPVGPAAPTVQTEIAAAPGNDEASCKKVDANLRAMAFRHFENFQEMQNVQGKYFSERAAQRASHLLGMVPKESAGETTNVTDMSGREFANYKSVSSLDRWNRMFSQRLTYNKQTNYGLAQQSMDRLVACFKVKSPLDDFLGLPDDACSGADVRKALAVYQGFAQGRLKQGDRAIPSKDRRDPNASEDMKKRREAGLDAALWHCGTRFMFEEGKQGEEGQKKLRQAMDSIADCDTGSLAPNMASEEQAKCFAKWVTLCPALNVDIAMLSPDSYFQTRNAPPLCENTFAKLTKTRPAASPDAAGTGNR